MFKLDKNERQKEYIEKRQKGKQTLVIEKKRLELSQTSEIMQARRK